MVVQWPSLPHHIPFIVVVGLSLSALFSLKLSLKLKARPIYACAIKPFYMLWKKTEYMTAVLGLQEHTVKQKACLMTKNRYIV